MRHGQKLILTVLMILAVALPWSISNSLAQNQVTMPPVEDYVLRFSTNDNPDKDYFSISTSEITLGGVLNPYTSAGVQAAYVGDLTFYHVDVVVFDRPVDLGEWLAFREEVESILPRKTHETGYNEALGTRTFYKYQSPTQVFRDGKYVDVKRKEPTGLAYVALFDERVIVKAYTFRDEGALTPEDIARFDDFAKTISITYEDVFDTTEQTYAYASPDLMVHLSQGQFVRSSIELLVPKDWIVEEKVLQEAEAGQPTGKIVVNMAPYGEAYPGEATENLLISIEGLPDQKLNSNTYKQAGSAILNQYVRSPKPVESRDVSDIMAEFIFGGHCLSDYKESANSGGVMASVYEGFNDQGLPVKALHVSSGGYYLACNYIYSASPERFDQQFEYVMELIQDLQVEFIGPPIEE